MGNGLVWFVSISILRLTTFAFAESQRSIEVKLNFCSGWCAVSMETQLRWEYWIENMRNIPGSLERERSPEIVLKEVSLVFKNITITKLSHSKLYFAWFIRPICHILLITNELHIRVTVKRCSTLMSVPEIWWRYC